jgi:hypothetical protein
MLHETPAETQRIMICSPAQFASFRSPKLRKLAKINTAKIQIETKIQCVANSSRTTIWSQQNGSE